MDKQVKRQEVLIQPLDIKEEHVGSWGALFYNLAGKFRCPEAVLIPGVVWAAKGDFATCALGLTTLIVMLLPLTWIEIYGKGREP